MAKRVTAAVSKSSEKLSKNFLMSEFTYSREALSSGLKNEPNAEQKVMIRWVAQNVAQPFRDKVGVPMLIKSGFRSKAVNKAVGGVDDSYHLFADGRWAFDFVVPSLSLLATMDLLKESGLPFTKAILETDQGVIHLQGLVVEYLVREVVGGEKIYSFLDDYKSKHHA
jgi:zinc D-Ala-D-Ala carboxypeptidase